MDVCPLFLFLTLYKLPLALASGTSNKHAMALAECRIGLKPGFFIDRPLAKASGNLKIKSCL
jgi:hypothetical protein